MPARVLTSNLDERETICENCYKRLAYSIDDVKEKSKRAYYGSFTTYYITCPNCQKQTEVKK